MARCSTTLHSAFSPQGFSVAAQGFTQRPSTHCGEKLGTLLGCFLPHCHYRVVWFRPTDQTDLEPIELFNVVSTITGLNFIGFRLVLRIRFGRFGWSKGSQSTTDGITPCNGRNHTIRHALLSRAKRPLITRRHKKRPRKGPVKVKVKADKF